jgi:hypothetical protein
MAQQGIRAAILIGLIFALLFVVTFTGVMKCSQLPLAGEAWCDVYWGIKTFATGGPKVLIVYGDSGLGNPIASGNGPEDNGSLEYLLAAPGGLSVHADKQHVDNVSYGVLKNYDIVIVDRAKQIETKQLRAFIEYATNPTGGTLIWTGDAGTQLGPDDHLLYTKDKNPDDDLNRALGPWSRRDGDYMVSFDELLGIKPVDANHITFCSMVNCVEGKPLWAGTMVTEPSGNHPLIIGISGALPLYVFKGQDFAIVETLSGGITNEVLSLDFGTEMSTPGYDLNRSAPLIVTSGIGERIIYYALPLEYYANPRIEEAGKGTYLLPIENMYYGTIKG